MTYIRLTQDEYIIQGNYGQYWEDVTCEDNKKDAKERLKEYHENKPEYMHKLIKRRVKIKSI